MGWNETWNERKGMEFVDMEWSVLTLSGVEWSGVEGNKIALD